MSNQWKVICKVSDIPVLGARVVKRASEDGMPTKTDVAIFRNSSDQFFALLDKCPHKGGPERVACPLHGWNIELGSGCAIAPDVGCTLTFSLKVEEGEVFLDAEELAHRHVETSPA